MEEATGEIGNQWGWRDALANSDASEIVPPTCPEVGDLSRGGDT